MRDSEARDSDHVQVFNEMPQINPAALNGVPQMPVALNGLPSMPETASDTPLPVDHAKYTPNNATNAWTNHFDPLGTPPERPAPNANDAFPSIMLNGLPQMPDINSTHNPARAPSSSSRSRSSSSNPSEDPFDEIVRMSHSQMQDYD